MGGSYSDKYDMVTVQELQQWPPGDRHLWLCFHPHRSNTCNIFTTDNKIDWRTTQCYCPNLVVLAWTRDDLWHGQAWIWRTHTHTDTHRQTDTGNNNTRRPKLASGKNNVNSTIHLTTLIIFLFSNFGPIWQSNAILLVWWTRSSILYQCLVMQPGLLVSGSIVQRIYLGKVKSYWLHFSSSKLYKTKFDTWT